MHRSSNLEKDYHRLFSSHYIADFAAHYIVPLELIVL